MPHAVPQEAAQGYQEEGARLRPAAGEEAHGCGARGPRPLPGLVAALGLGGSELALPRGLALALAGGPPRALGADLRGDGDGAAGRAPPLAAGGEGPAHLALGGEGRAHLAAAAERSGRALLHFQLLGGQGGRLGGDGAREQEAELQCAGGGAARAPQEALRDDLGAQGVYRGGVLVCLDEPAGRGDAAGRPVFGGGCRGDRDVHAHADGAGAAGGQAGAQGDTRPLHGRGPRELPGAWVRLFCA
mmetsp:Transcript_9551/g.22307  ORF Transcript_9551/g.22307 Transcript_9551/m.22307 type:complete len:245 (-) Transcript_9551:1515-2249(-)